MLANISWPVMATIISALASVIGGLVLFNLKSIKSCIHGLINRLAKNEQDVQEVKDRMNTCKIDCERNTVSKEDWVRSEGYTRQELKSVTSLLNRLDGKLDVVSKLPEICADIAGKVVQQMSKEKNQ